MKLPPALSKFIQARRTHDPRARDALVASGLVTASTLVPFPEPASSLTLGLPPSNGAPTQLFEAPANALQPYQTRSQALAPSSGGLATVASALDTAAAGMTKADIRARLVQKYTTLGLLDANGTWTVPELAPHAAELLPDDLDGPAMQRFVARMAEAAANNPYLAKFFDAAQRTSFPAFHEKFLAEGATALPDVLAHAQLLDRLTRVLASDYRVSEATRAHWKSFESNPKFWDELNVFERVKLLSVNMGIDKYNEIHRTGVVDPSTLAGVLPMNIMEAWTVDQYWAATGPAEARLGHADNAFAGWVLATHGPQGEGPATLSEDGKMVELHQKATKAWDDLYATWNMGFVFGVSGDLKYLTKLVIPEVNDYAAQPAQYINKRALALHITMINNAMEGLSGGREYVNWSDPALGALWGKVNANSARAYVVEARRHAAKP